GGSGAPPPAPPPPGGAEPYVPYGGAPVEAAFYATATPKKNAWVGIVIGIVVLIAVCGGGVTALIAAITTIDDAVTSAESDDLLANDLEVGQCLIGAGLDPGTDDPVSALEVIDCAEAHDAEVLAVKVLSAEEAAAYDFEDDDGAVTSCEPLFSAKAKRLLERQDLFLFALTETATPVTGDKVACLLVDANGEKLFGSLQDDLAEEMISPAA
uniref:hypothetical protein n=1 Tax=Nocardioides stalactiti TaxID=2755356 RepID=UPI0015FF17E8